MLKREKIKIKTIVLLYRIYLRYGVGIFPDSWRVFILDDDIDPLYDKEMNSVFRSYSKFGRITLLIDSCGGYVSGARYIIDSIHNIHHNINAVNVGKCYSAAVLVYLACCHRVATRNSDFVVHHAMGRITGFFRNCKRVEGKILKLLEQYDEDFYMDVRHIQIQHGSIVLNIDGWSRVSKLLAKHNNTFYNHIKGAINAVISTLEREYKFTERIIISQTRISKKLLDEKIGGGKDWRISAEEALRLGICHEII